ncbi:MAG TPA: hypothetical protein VKY24_00550 [Reyranella sp.]|nr:hypothetical protein [Reyranella sp.]
MEKVRSLTLAIALLCALADAARAQTETCDTSAGPPSQEFELYATEQWPKEAARFKGDADNVSREGERLRLKLDGGGTAELADCRHGITAHAYLFEQYDEAGRFYVVRRPAYRDFSYTLVMRATGRQYRVYGTPVWTSDKKRFLTVACSWIPPRGALTIQAPANGELATEAEVPLPTCLDETETCAARWDNPFWIAVTCTRGDGSSRRGSEFVVLKGSDGAWKTFGR